VTYHVPGELAEQVRKVSQFRLRFLHAILAEVPNARRCRVADGVGRESLCDGDKSYFVRRPVAALARGLDSAPYVFNAPSDRLNAHSPQV
jgi:hypothetical protein